MAGGYITDKRTLALLEDARLAKEAGVDFNRIRSTKQYKQAFQKHGSGFRVAHQYGKGSFGQGVLEGVGDTVVGGSQLVAHGLNKLSNKIVGDDERDYYDAVAKVRDISMRDESTAGRIVGNLLVPVPGGNKVRAGKMLAKDLLATGAKQGGFAAALQPTTGDNFAADKAAQVTTGAVFGAPANLALGKVAQAAGKTRVPSQFEQRLEAAKRQGMDLGLFQSSDRSVTRNVADVMSQLPGGGTLVRKGEQVAKQFEEKAGDTAEKVGQVRGKADLGSTVRKGISGGVERFDERSENLFNGVTKAVPMNTQVDLTKARKAMIDTVDAFPSAPGLGSELANGRLQRMADTLTDSAGNAKPLFFNEAQRLRSEIGKMLGEGGLKDDIPRRELAKVYAALTDDMRSAIQPHGDALKKWDTATRYYKLGRNRINKVLQPLVSGHSDESVVDRLTSMVKNNAKGARSIRQSMKPEEWDDVAATIFSQLGREKPGWQDATGAGFSVTSFLTDFNKLRDNKEAFEHAFGGTRYAALRDVYGDLGVVADSIKQSKRLSNPSRSGYVAGLIGMGAALLTQPALVAKAVGGNMIASRMLASPRFARWLLKTGKLTHQGLATGGAGSQALMKAHFERLPAIAAGNSDIADGVSSLYQYLIGGGK